MPDTTRTGKSRLGHLAALLGDEARYRGEEVAIILRRAHRRARISMSERAAAKRTAAQQISTDVKSDIESAIFKALRGDHGIDNMISLIGRSGYRQHRLGGMAGDDLIRIARELIASGKIRRNSDGTFSLNPNNSNVR